MVYVNSIGITSGLHNCTIPVSDSNSFGNALILFQIGDNNGADKEGKTVGTQFSDKTIGTGLFGDAKPYHNPITIDNICLRTHKKADCRRFLENQNSGAGFWSGAHKKGAKLCELE